MSFFEQYFRYYCKPCDLDFESCTDNHCPYCGRFAKDNQPTKINKGDSNE